MVETETNAQALAAGICLPHVCIPKTGGRAVRLIENLAGANARLTTEHKGAENS